MVKGGLQSWERFVTAAARNEQEVRIVTKRLSALLWTLLGLGVLVLEYSQQNNYRTIS